MVLPHNNRAVVYRGAFKVETCDVGAPAMVDVTTNMPLENGVILKVICAAVCGSDMHMFRGRCEVKHGLPLGHEVVGEVVQVGREVKTLRPGDMVIVPFNVACGVCQNCAKQNTQICLRVNREMPGGAYGYALMGDWAGGQAEYFFAPWADFNCLKVANKHLGLDRIFDLVLLTDVMPTAYHTAVMAGVGPGKTVYIAGAGPVGITAARICRELLGAARVIIGDVNPERLVGLREFGIDTIDLSRERKVSEAVKRVMGYEYCDAVLECVGFDGGSIQPMPEDKKLMDTWTQLVEVCEYGGNIHITGVYMPQDQKGANEMLRQGVVPFPLGQVFAKGITITSGQCPAARYMIELYNCVMQRGFSVYRQLRPKVISLEQGSQAYQQFERGAHAKFLFDPHGIVRHHFGNNPPADVQFL